MPHNYITMELEGYGLAFQGVVGLLEYESSAGCNGNANFQDLVRGNGGGWHDLGMGREILSGHDDP